MVPTKYLKGEPQVRKKSSKIGVFSAIDAFRL